MADGALPSTLEVNALRDSFGDRKPPDITRKITACVACRKQKVSPFTVNLIYSDTLLNRCGRSNVICAMVKYHVLDARKEDSLVQ